MERTDEVEDAVRSAVEGVTFVKSAVNLGLCGRLQSRRKAARGEYLVLLNDDALVEHGWLDWLVHTADAQPAAGAVCSCVLFPDGTVQEAGLFSGTTVRRSRSVAACPATLLPGISSGQSTMGLRARFSCAVRHGTPSAAWTKSIIRRTTKTSICVSGSRLSASGFSSSPVRACVTMNPSARKAPTSPFCSRETSASRGEMGERS